MRAVFALNPEALRRLVAKGVVADPLVQNAFQNGKVIVTAGLTNAYVMEELTGKPMPEKWRFGVGVVTQNGLGVTTIAKRITPVCFEKGQVIDPPWNEYLNELRSHDVIIKGCNAFDSENRAGVFLGGTTGGTVGLITGIVSAQGINLVIAATHDKFVPSVPEAARALGIDRTDLCTGMKIGLGIVENAHLVTEVQALHNLFGVKAVIVGGGGYNGAQGSIVISADGETSNIEAMWKLIEQIRNEEPIIDVETEA
ncbi:MAG: hypothetical protein ACM3NT_01965 [Methylocystaceae bacterium]